MTPTPEMLEKARAFLDEELDIEDPYKARAVADFAQSAVRDAVKETGAAVRDVVVALKRYLDHDPACPEFRQEANRHNKGMVQDTAFKCRCGLTALRQKFGVSE